MILVSDVMNTPFLGIRPFIRGAWSQLKQWSHSNRQEMGTFRPEARSLGALSFIFMSKETNRVS